MKWLEIIELRSVGIDRETLKENLMALIHEVKAEHIDQDIDTFSKAVLDTDFRIHLHHESQLVSEQGSALGLNLAEACREFGLVNHSVWIELNPGKGL